MVIRRLFRRGQLGKARRQANNERRRLEAIYKAAQGTHKLIAYVRFRQAAAEEKRTERAYDAVFRKDKKR